MLDGAQVAGMQHLSVGRDGSFGDLLIDGVGSLVSVTGTTSPEARGGGATLPFVSYSVIGRNGTGNVTVRNGGSLSVSATVRGDGSPALDLGRDPGSFGRLSIIGSGSVVSMSAQSVLAGGGPGEAFNPLLRVGRDGSGELNITQGGKLLMHGGALATVADARNTSLYIGGVNSTTIGGKGTALVSGTGSEIRMTGADPHLAVGWGPQAFGQMTLADQALVDTRVLEVGGAGGTGVFKMDSASTNLSGQFAAGTQSGAVFVVGSGGGVGVATMANGSRMTISNPGSNGAGVLLGGTALRPGGDGSLTMTGGSRIDIQAEPGLGILRIGRDGSAMVRMRGASAIDVGDGQVIIARDKGSDGTLLMSENSSLSAGWVGIGRNKTETGDVDGGTGTVVLINSTLTAPTIVVGTNGFLGGTGTIVGNVTNYGIFAPGNSPGVIEIDGSFAAQAGSKTILEIESDGNGGFLTDLV
ncbi:MAG: hypothetical protein KDH48_13200, partial [Rhodoferax sp.]|nr:hypothetical protein [Rhodoferax sp.]